MIIMGNELVNVCLGMLGVRDNVRDNPNQPWLGAHVIQHENGYFLVLRHSHQFTTREHPGTNGPCNGGACVLAKKLSEGVTDGLMYVGECGRQFAIKEQINPDDLDVDLIMDLSNVDNSPQSVATTITYDDFEPSFDYLGTTLGGSRSRATGRYYRHGKYNDDIGPQILATSEYLPTFKLTNDSRLLISQHKVGPNSPTVEILLTDDPAGGQGVGNLTAPTACLMAELLRRSIARVEDDPPFAGNTDIRLAKDEGDNWPYTTRILLAGVTSYVCSEMCVLKDMCSVAKLTDSNFDHRGNPKKKLDTAKMVEI